MLLVPQSLRCIALTYSSTKCKKCSLRGDDLMQQRQKFWFWSLEPISHFMASFLFGSLICCKSNEVLGRGVKGSVCNSAKLILWDVLYNLNSSPLFHVSGWLVDSRGHRDRSPLSGHRLHDGQRCHGKSQLRKRGCLVHGMWSVSHKRGP